MLPRLYKIFVVLFLAVFLIVACGEESRGAKNEEEEHEPELVMQLSSPLSRSPLIEQEQEVSMQNETLLFFVDISQSGEGKYGDRTICEPSLRLQNVRYEIPKFIISIVAAIRPYSNWPKIGVFEFGEQKINTLVEVKAPITFREERNWSDALSSSRGFKQGTHYLPILIQVEDMIESDEFDAESLTVIIISDGWFTGDTSERNEFREKLRAMRELYHQIDFILVQAYCPEMNSVLDFNTDKDMWGNNLAGNVYPFTEAESGEPFVALVSKLFENVEVLSRMLPDEEHRGWVMARGNVLNISWDGFTELNMGIVSLSQDFAYKITTTQTNKEGTSFHSYELNGRTPHLFLTEFLDGFPNLEALECGKDYKWTLISEKIGGEEGADFPPAFYWWDTKSLPLILQPDYTLSPFSENLFQVNVKFLEENHPYIFARSACYRLSWRLTDINEVDIANDMVYFSADDCMKHMVSLPFKENLFSQDKYTPPFFFDAVLEKKGIDGSYSPILNNYLEIQIPPAFGDYAVFSSERIIKAKIDYLQNYDVKVFALTPKTPEQIRSLQEDCKNSSTPNPSQNCNYETPFDELLDGGFYPLVLKRQYYTISPTGLVDINLSASKFRATGYDTVDILITLDASQRIVMRCYVDKKYCEKIKE